MEWSPQIWTQILNADLSIITSELPIIQYEAEWYRDVLYRRHSESNNNLLSKEYTEEQLLDFSRKTARQYIEWLR